MSKSIDIKAILSNNKEPKFTGELSQSQLTQALNWYAQNRDAKDAEQGKAVREDRNRRLAECDWTQLGDSPLDPDGKGAWALYRETLRMVPQQEGFPWNVQWPPKPGS